MLLPGKPSSCHYSCCIFRALDWLVDLIDHNTTLERRVKFYARVEELCIFPWRVHMEAYLDPQEAAGGVHNGDDRDGVADGVFPIPGCSIVRCDHTSSAGTCATRQYPYATCTRLMAPLWQQGQTYLQLRARSEKTSFTTLDMERQTF